MAHVRSNLNNSPPLSDNNLAWLIDSKDEESISDSHTPAVGGPIIWRPRTFLPFQHPLTLMVGK